MTEKEFFILRGKRIEEFTRQELITLYHQLEAELPDNMNQLEQSHAPKLLELDLIQDELERRHETL